MTQPTDTTWKLTQDKNRRFISAEVKDMWAFVGACSVIGVARGELGARTPPPRENKTLGQISKGKLEVHPGKVIVQFFDEIGEMCTVRV